MAPLGILDNEKATCYPNPSMTEKLKDKSQAKDSVVVSNKVITSQAPGTTFKWALTCIEKLCGEPKMKEIASATVSMV